MRILFIIQSWEPEQGPAQWRIRRFIDFLHNRGIESVLITSSCSDADARQASSRTTVGQAQPKILRTPRGSTSRGLLWRIVDQGVVAGWTIILGLSRVGTPLPSCVVATVPAIPSAFAGFVISRLIRRPFIIDLRDAWPDLISEIDNWNRANRDGHKLIDVLVRPAVKLGAFTFSQVLKTADLIITTSEKLERSLLCRGLKNVTTIRNTPGHLPDPLPQVARHDGELRILYPGTIGRAQGLSNAVEALRLCRHAGTQVTLRLIGSGAELEDVKQAALGLGDAIEFLDPVPVQEMAPHYAWSDACLVHLRDWEPLERTVPSKLVETMARGKPVCLAANGEAAEMVKMTGAGEVARAMVPEDLADIWMRWAREGVPSPNAAAVNTWLSENADPLSTSEKFADCVQRVVTAFEINRR